MNLSKALAHMAPRAPGGSASVEEALAAWRQRFAPGADPRRTVATTGVRSALRNLFSHLAAAERELWLPADVYPEYWRYAAEEGLAGRAFATLPELDLTFLAETAECATVLLPHPLTPLGRFLTDEEAGRLLTWLGQVPARRVILDAVYLFDNQLDAAARRLLASHQALFVHSIAKAWLLPDTFGVILSPDAHITSLEVSTTQLAPEKLAAAAFALGSCADLPLELSATFRRQWAALADQIQEASPDWRPPLTGYFSVIPVPFDELLQRHGVLGAPASIFGARRDDVSVISCLYYAT
jgi:aspartate/methionine/tyrosine aminotransferase